MKHAIAGLALTLALTLAPAGRARAQEALRPEVGNPLARAKSLAVARRFPEAMAQLRAASAVRGLTANENFVIEELRAYIANQSGDLAGAARAYSDLLASGRVPVSEQLKLYINEAGISSRLKDYPGVINWVQKYLKAGGTDPAMRTQMIQAYYAQKDYPTAAKLQSAQVAAELAARQRPAEEQLLLLQSALHLSNDTVGYGNAMAQLVTYYPKPDYWLNLIHAANTRPGYSTRLDLDIHRFELATGLLTKPAELMEMTELALQVPLPGEARAIVDAAYTAGTFGTGADAPRQQRLRDLVNKTYDSELRALPGRTAEAQASHDGNLAAALGEEYVSYGNFNTGIPLILTALKKDALRHPDDTRLHLGLAYMKAGQKAQAIATFKTVGGKEGAAEIARLWILNLSKS